MKQDKSQQKDEKEPKIDLLWSDLYQSYKQFKSRKESRCMNTEETRRELFISLSIFFQNPPFFLAQLLEANVAGSDSSPLEDTIYLGQPKVPPHPEYLSCLQPSHYPYKAQFIMQITVYYLVSDFSL